MKRTAALCAALAVLLAGCGDDSGDSDTASAGGGGGGGATATTMAGMGGAGGAGPVDHLGNPTSTCSPSGNALTITVNGTKFDKDCLAAPASQAFTITIDNKDGVVHNIAILESHHATDVLFRADAFRGPQSQTFSVGALRPGTYAFHCEIHPDKMSGTFSVK